MHSKLSHIHKISNVEKFVVVACYRKIRFFNISKIIYELNHCASEVFIVLLCIRHITAEQVYLPASLLEFQ